MSSQGLMAGGGGGVHKEAEVKRASHNNLVIEDIAFDTTHLHVKEIDRKKCPIWAYTEGGGSEHRGPFKILFFIDAVPF